MVSQQDRRQILAGALWASLLLVLSGALAGAAMGKVSGFTAELVTTLTPAILVFIAAQQQSGFGAARGDSGLLLPALVGFGGAALLLPYSLPGSAEGYLWLLALMVAAGLSGWAILRLHTILRGWSLLHAAGIFAAGAAALALVGHVCLREGVGIGLGALSGRDRLLLAGREVGVAALLDAPSLLLMVWLLGRLRPVHFVLLYLLVPLVSVAEAFLLMRPTTDWTLPAGVLILLGSVGVMLHESRTIEPLA